jgi:hypothetical protein
MADRLKPPEHRSPDKPGTTSIDAWLSSIPKRPRNTDGIYWHVGGTSRVPGAKGLVGSLRGHPGPQDENASKK